MKKITLSFVALAMSAISFAALNPYAYGLSSALSADETKLTVNYSLNADATAVNIVVLDGETFVKSFPCEGIAKGTYSVEIPTTDFPKTKSLTWKVDVKGAAVAEATAVKTYRFFHPSGIDVDNNPESLNFGRILCLEANHSVKTTTASGYLGKGYGAGIYAFDPTFEPILNGTYPGFNGGNTFTTTHYAVRRIRISDDGRIFVTAQNNGGCFLWEVDPDNLNSWTKVFQGTEGTYTTTTADGKFIAGTNSGFDVHGSGENLKLLMLSASVSGSNSATFRCDEYDLGTAKTWSTVPSRTISGANYHIVTNQSNVQYDKDGGVWHIQYRATCTDALPGLVHINKDGVEDFKWLRHYTRNAGFCFNKDFTKVIVAGKFQNEIGTQKYATIYAVSKDVDGKPVLTEELVVDMTNIGAALNDFAWDYADNIYAVDNSGEYLCAYALPHAADKVISTPCASKYAFQLQEEVVGTFYTVTANANDPAMGEITGNDGQYTAGATATLTAVPAAGYEFVNWTVGEETKTENPLTLIVNSDLTVTANFVALPQYTITATANDAAMGSVTGAGTYYEGEEVTLKAIANQGHEFVDWNNGATEATLTFVATKDSAVVANFKKLSYTVSLATNDENKGTVAGAGTYDYGTEVELTATAADGYELLYWSDRSTENPRTITVDGNEALSAYFVKTYTQEPTFTIEKLWENTNVPSSTNNGYQAAGWDQKIYMKDRVGQEILVFSDATTSATYATTDKADDQSITADDAGNLILRSGSAGFYSTPKQVIIYKKDETKYTTINFTLPAGGRCDFISASGDVFSEEGGYVYFYCQNKTTVNRVKIANGEYVSVEQIGNNLTTGQTQAQVTKNIFGNLITHARTANPQEVDVTTGMVNNIILPNFKISTCGMATFELGGKEWIAYNVAGTDWNSEWNLYNMTDQKFLSETALYAKNTTEKNTAANWLNVQVVDEKTAYIYQFCPMVAVAVWKVTCDTGEEPGTGTAVENTNVAVQVQKIIRNGQVLIIRDGKTFNMMGQEVR